MKTIVEILSPNEVFTNDDIIPVQITLKRGFEDSFQPAYVDSIKLNLLCESKFTLGAIEKIELRYEGPIKEARLKRCERDFAVYVAALRFPTASSTGEPLVGSMLLGPSEDGFKWIIHGDIFWRNGPIGEQVLDSFEKTCTFRPTGTLPALLKLVDVEHNEEVDGTRLSVVTTHAADGIPQVPLKAGLGLRVACAELSKFSISRIRLILRDTTTILVGSNRILRGVSSHRWLLADLQFNGNLRLDKVATNLDSYVEDVCVDHSTITPTFETKDVCHKFMLLTELTLCWGEQSRKVVSQNPVVLLARISGTANGVDSFPVFEPVSVTDSSLHLDTDSDSEDESLKSIMSVHAKYDDVALPAIRTEMLN